MPAIQTQTIQFAPGRKATVFLPGTDDKPQDLAQQLAPAAYNGVVLVIGGADSMGDDKLPLLTQLFDRGIARSALTTNSLVVDGGTNVGVMALMGRGVESRGRKTTLIGVAPRSMVILPDQPVDQRLQDGAELEPNHTHFVLPEGEGWGSETAFLFGLVTALANPPAHEGKRRPKVGAVTVLAGGGNVAKKEAVQAVRNGFPLLVVKGSGGFADELVAAFAQPDAAPGDAAVAEILSDGAVHFHTLGDPVLGMERLIIRELGTDKVLGQAWETFARYDRNANLQQKRFSNLQMTILVLGVVATALAIFQQVFYPTDMDVTPLPGKILRYILILIPIVLTILITYSNRFKQGNKWLLLRAGAEAIKREIFRYRVRGYYRDNPEQQLAQKVEDITRRTMRTEVNTSALQPYKGETYPPQMDESLGADDGFSLLPPDRYVEIRLGDQLSYFQNKSVKLEQQLKFYSWAIFVAGGLGTFLAAINYPVWIALTTAVGAAFGTYLGYRQTENTLTKYNQASTDLANVRAWWNALSAAEQARQVNINALVDHTEQVLQTELDGWVQQMQDALAELRKNQETTIQKKEEKREPGTGDPTTETIEVTTKRPVNPAAPAEAEDVPAGTATAPSAPAAITPAVEGKPVTPPDVKDSEAPVQAPEAEASMPAGEVTEADLAGSTEEKSFPAPEEEQEVTEESGLAVNEAKG